MNKKIINKKTSYKKFKKNKYKKPKFTKETSISVAYGKAIDDLLISLLSEELVWEGLFYVCSLNNTLSVGRVFWFLLSYAPHTYITWYEVK